MPTGPESRFAPPIYKWSDAPEFRVFLSELADELSDRLEKLASVTAYARVLKLHEMKDDWESWFFNTYLTRSLLFSRAIGCVLEENASKCSKVIETIRASPYSEMFFNDNDDPEVKRMLQVVRGTE